MENYFNYFTEIEEHFCRRRGNVMLLSTLDWALIETWKDAGIPLQAVLRGIDAAFDTYEKRPLGSRKVNSLAYCSQEVLAAAEDMKEAAIGAVKENGIRRTERGFDPTEIAQFLRRNAEALDTAQLPERAGISSRTVARETARILRELADQALEETRLRLEDLERRLTVLEEKLFAALLATTPDEDVVSVRAQADREFIPYRSKMPAAQIDQLQSKYLYKRLLEKYGIPRLSLFYL